MYTLYTKTHDAWEAMLSDIAAAEQSIYAEFYIMIDDATGMRFFDILEKKAKEGVRVCILVDTFGSSELSGKTVKRLRNAGVYIQFFHLFRGGYRHPWKRFFSRLHRKVLVIDRSIGYVGGVNIEEKMKDWDDFCLRVLDQPQAEMLATSIEDSMLFNDKNFRTLRDVHFAASEYAFPQITYWFSKGKSFDYSNRKMYLKLIANARKSIDLCTPYFYPDRELLDNIIMAGKRGVRVRLLLPKYSDVFVATYSTRAYVDQLLRSGIIVYFITDTMLHAKGMIVDDTVAVFGSTNLDITSFYDNFELDIETTNLVLVRAVTAAYSAWQEQGEEAKRVQWNRRGIFHKMKEGIAIYLYRIWHFRVRARFRWRYVYRVRR